MRRSLALAQMLLAALAGALFDPATLWADAPIAPEVPTAVYSRQRVFSIPFKIDQPAPAGASPRTVQLHVSEDQGQTWRVAEKTEPTAGRFSFRTERDGEFWFFVRTLDERGELQPVGPPTPELRVIVDTLAPRLKLEQQIGSGGEITATWQILDQNLKADTFQLEFQPIGATSWEIVNTPRDHRPGQRVVDGQVTWWPGASTGKVRLRAGVMDLAGNPAMNQLDVDLDRRPAAAIVAVPAPQDRLTANRSTHPPESAGAPPPADRTATRPSQASRWNPDYSAREPFRPESWDDGRAEPMVARPAAGTTAGAEEVPAPVPVETIPPGELADRVPASPRRGQPVSTGNNEVGRSYSDQRPSDQTAWDEAETLPPAGRDWDAHPNAGQLGDPRGSDAVSPTASGELPLPAGQTPKFVNSLRFELEYDVESVGPAGIGRVELWGTKDGGRTWETFGIDPDNRSPFVITVEDEGTYGFQIVVESGTGLGGLPPKSGDAAEIWVRVDLTAPVVNLIAIDQGAEDRAGELVIRWEATDALLGARPVSLAFRDARGGEWATFASGLQNTGRHLWQIDRRVPEQIYLRVEVRDAAGNVAVADSFEPISLDRVRPQGRIRDVRPARETTQGARQERTFWR